MGKEETRRSKIKKRDEWEINKEENIEGLLCQSLSFLSITEH